MCPPPMIREERVRHKNVKVPMYRCFLCNTLYVISLSIKLHKDPSLLSKKLKFWISLRSGCFVVVVVVIDIVFVVLIFVAVHIGQ